MFYNGSSWSFVVTNLAPATLTYGWTVPNSTLTGCKVRVGLYNITTGAWVVSGTSIIDDSDTFSINAP